MLLLTNTSWRQQLKRHEQHHSRAERPVCFLNRKAPLTERKEWIRVIYCHFRFCYVWVRALPQAPGKPQHSTAALKETRRCCHHGRVGSKALTSGAIWSGPGRRTGAGRWPCVPGCFWHCQPVFGKKKKTAKRLVLVRHRRPERFHKSFLCSESQSQIAESRC